MEYYLLVLLSGAMIPIHTFTPVCTLFSMCSSDIVTDFLSKWTRAVDGIESSLQLGATIVNFLSVCSY